MSLAGPLLGVESSLESFGQLLRLAFAPEVSEVEDRFLADHVIVQRDDVQFALAKCMKHRLNFRGGHRKIAVNDCELFTAGEGCPGRQPHTSAKLHFVHGGLAADGELHHAVLSGAF